MSMLIPGYCIVAQKGHVQHIGYVTETDVCGVKMLQVMVPSVNGDDTREPLPVSAIIVNPETIYNIVESDVESTIRARMKVRPTRKVEPVALALVTDDTPKPLPFQAGYEMQHGDPCSHCNGTGKRGGQDCTICDGTGTYEVPF